MTKPRILMTGTGAALALVLATAASAKLMTWSEFRAIPVPQATKRIAYGIDPAQFVDFWKPDTPPPYLVVIMVHGGCWQAGVAKLDIMNHAAEDLRRRGIAVWNIEYRGVDQPGGGYPGTFQDAAMAADSLRRHAADKRLALDRVIAVGHSAGGHLALWLAARPRLPKTSVLYDADPLPISGVVSLGGLPDLVEARARGDDSCGTDAIDRLTGVATASHPDVLADTSLPALLPLGVPEILVHGALDPISPPSIGQSFVTKASRAGDQASLEIVPDAGHVEEITPGQPAWTSAASAIERLLGR